MQEKLHTIQESISLLIPEFLLAGGILLLIFISFFNAIRSSVALFVSLAVVFFTALLVIRDIDQTASLLDGMLRKESFSGVLKLFMNAAAALTLLMCVNNTRIRSHHFPEFCALILSIVLGGHFLLMSNNLLMVFLSLEVVSISSYVLAGFNSDRTGSEGSLKYFIFGSVASAIMLYGFTILYGLTGTLDFSTEGFARNLIENDSPLALLAGLMALSGFLFKISAAPMHLWTPDVYESAPIPVIAFFSVAPKLAGLGILAKFILTINVYGQTSVDWQVIIAAIAILTLTVGNFSALAQVNAKRMMAYSSIAQSGFLLVGVAAFLPQGLHFMLFYAGIYLLMNFLVFVYLEYFEQRGIQTIADFKGAGRSLVLPSVFLLIGLIALTGLPPTAGFTAKLFIFSALWESYELSGKPILLWLLIFGLLNTVVSLFYYLKIPYFAFIKGVQSNESPLLPSAQGININKQENIRTLENLLGLILVLAVVALFFIPGVLMGWINKVNFVF